MSEHPISKHRREQLLDGAADWVVRIQSGELSSQELDAMMARNQTSASRNQASRNSGNGRDDDEPAASALDMVVVVGTNIRGVRNPTNPVITFDEVYIERTGFSTSEGLLTSLPENFGAGSSRNTFTDLARSPQGISFYRLCDELGPRIDQSTVDHYGAATSINVEFSDRWSARLHGNYVKEELESLRKNVVNQVALADALRQSDPQLVFNPFGDGAGGSQQLINSLYQDKYRYRTFSNPNSRRWLH